jgi:carboxyl-terminal processing protease
MACTTIPFKLHMEVLEQMQNFPSTKLNDGLTSKAKHEVFEGVLSALAKKFYKPELLENGWHEAVANHRPIIEKAPTLEAFEQAVTALLQNLNTSHVGFFHQSARRASSRAALSATYLADQTAHGSRWIFQDVHEGGAAALAGIQPGDILLRLDDKEIIPPEHPVFPMGTTSKLTIVANDDSERKVTVDVSKPKGKRLHFVEPTLVQSNIVGDGIGYLKVAMFPGMIGVDVANEITKAVVGLGKIRGLIIDLRGNTGGGAGALRLMSLLTPEKIPVGFAPGKRWAGRDLANEKNTFPRFGSIPSSKKTLWLLALRYLPSLVSKSPIVLESEGYGPHSYQGNVVLLVDRHTASAAEMVTIFAKENKLATIVGEKTAGRLLSATSVKVGHGFRLALPTGAYHTWSGTALEGNPIEPDVFSEFNWRDRRSGYDRQFDTALQIAGAQFQK